MSPIWVNFLGNWGEITLKVDRFHEAFTQRHKRVCHPQKIYPRSPKNLHGYIRHIRDIFQLCKSALSVFTSRSGPIVVDCVAKKMELYTQINHIPRKKQKC